jgi:hypothetical protein
MSEHNFRASQEFNKMVTADVSFWHKADIPRPSSDVRYWGVERTLLTQARRIAANIAKLPELLR